MQDLKKRFWKQQTRLIIVVMAGAVGSTTFGSWLTSGHLDPSARAQAVLTSAAMSAVVASLLLAYTLRQTMRYLRLHLRVRHHPGVMDPGRQKAAIFILRLILAGPVLREQHMSAKPRVSDLAPPLCQISFNSQALSQKTPKFLP